jgi:CheY-like chemotaxis protein
MHLADNARNAMPGGGQLRISTAAPTTPNPDATTQPCAVLTISDTGVGMSEKTLGHIFEPFFSTKDTTVASGLGLSTVHGIISQSKGRIECQSSLGQGTTFRIYLPIAAERRAATPASLTSENNGFRILLAEDDPAVNKHLSHSLRKAGFSVDSVGNGEEALTNFGRHTYHVVVTDVLMPKLGGIELTRRLRQLVPSLPVVLISGSNVQESVLQHFPNEQPVYLQKPFSSSQLVTTVHNLLSGIKQT